MGDQARFCMRILIGYVFELLLSCLGALRNTGESIRGSRGSSRPNWFAKQPHRGAESNVCSINLLVTPAQETDRCQNNDDHGNSTIDQRLPVFCGPFSCSLGSL